MVPTKGIGGRSELHGWLERDEHGQLGVQQRSKQRARQRSAGERDQRSGEKKTRRAAGEEAATLLETRGSRAHANVKKISGS